MQTVVVDNPTFLGVARSHRMIYAALHTPQFRGHSGGGIASFRINPITGLLSSVNEKLVPSTHPNYVRIDGSERVAMVASGLGGALSVFPLQSDGTLGDVSDLLSHPGRPAVPLQPDPGVPTDWPPMVPPGSPFPHSIAVDPSNSFALVPDLYLNRVFVYRLDADRGKLTPHQPAWIEAPTGAGPRHIAFHPDGRDVFVVNQHGSSVTTFGFARDSGTLTEMRTVTSIPADYCGENASADIAVHPSGRYVYASNRGHDSIAIFEVNSRDRALEPRGFVSTGGAHPRGFRLTPDGRLLLVANQNTNNVVTFAVNDATGGLEATGAVTEVPSPTCIAFFGS